MEEEYGQSKYDAAGWPRWTDAARWTDAVRRPSTGATRFVRSAAVSARAVCAGAVSVRVVFTAICDAISAATAGSAGAIFLPSGCIHAIDAEVCSGPQQSPWLQQSAVSGQSQPLQQSPISQQPQPMQRSPWSRQVPQQVPQQSGPYSDSNPAAGVVATESQDHRFDLLPNRIVNIVFSVVSLFIMFLPGLSWGVGAGGLRGKLILAVVLLVVGVVGIVYMLVKAVPRLRLAKDVGCGWKVGMSGRTTVVLTAVVLAAGGVLTAFTASDYSTGPVTDTVTFVDRGTFSGSTTSAYYEFRTDSGRKFRISLANGDEGLMPSGLESGQRVTLTYYPRTGILVPDPAPTLAE